MVTGIEAHTAGMNYAAHQADAGRIELSDS
jgi:hypothetical protein